MYIIKEKKNGGYDRRSLDTRYTKCRNAGRDHRSFRSRTVVLHSPDEGQGQDGWRYADGGSPLPGGDGPQSVGHQNSQRDDCWTGTREPAALLGRCDLGKHTDR